MIFLTALNLANKGKLVYDAASTMDNLVSKIEPRDNFPWSKKELTTSEKVNLYFQWAFTMLQSADIVAHGALILTSVNPTLLLTTLGLSGLFDVIRTVTAKEDKSWETKDSLDLGATFFTRFTDVGTATLQNLPQYSESYLGTLSVTGQIPRIIAQKWWESKPNSSNEETLSPPQQAPLSSEARAFIVDNIRKIQKFVTTWEREDSLPEWLEQNEDANRILIYRCTLSKKFIRHLRVPDLKDKQVTVRYDRVELEKWVKLNGKGHELPRWKEIFCCRKLNYPKGWPKTKLRRLKLRSCEEGQNAIDQSLKNLAENLKSQLPDMMSYLNH